MSDEFAIWARSEFSKLIANLNPCNENEELDPNRLNHVLSKFSMNYAWLVTFCETLSNTLSIYQLEYDRFCKKSYTLATRSAREEKGGTKATVKDIEARIEIDFGDKDEELRRRLELQRSRVMLIRNFLKVMEKQASILQTLCSNMRSELFFTGGVPVATGGGRDSDIKNPSVGQAKSILRRSISTDYKTDKSRQEQSNRS